MDIHQVLMSLNWTHEIMQPVEFGVAKSRLARTSLSKID